MTDAEIEAELTRREKKPEHAAHDEDAAIEAALMAQEAGLATQPAPLHVQKTAQGLGMVPEHRAHAVFSDMPGQSFTAEQLGNVKQDTTNQRKAALIGGALQGATMGWGDELGAAAGSLMGDGTYKDLRAENRAANKTAEAWSPGDFAAGKLAGGAASAFIPGLAPSGKLLTVPNTLRAAVVGGAQALGESQADLTNADFGPAISDTAKGLAVGAGVNTGLGLMGAGYRSGKGYVEGLPAALAKHEDERLIDAATLGAPASQRDALVGPLGQDRRPVLDLVRSHPEIEAALKNGDSETAAKLVIKARAEQDAYDSQTLAEMQRQRGNASAAPIIAQLEKQRDAAAAIPSAESQAEAAKVQKLIDFVTDKWVPTPPVPAPKGPELLAKLAEKADTGDKQRIGSNAESFLAVAEKHKLGEVANDPIATEARIGDSLKQLGERREKLYDQVKEPLLITDVTRPLAKWRDELASNGATVEDAAKVDGLIKNIWKAHGQDGKLTIAPKEARALISGTQEKAFSGAYIDPGLAKEMQRKAAGIMKDALDRHVERTAGAPNLGQPAKAPGTETTFPADPNEVKRMGQDPENFVKNTRWFHGTSSEAGLEAGDFFDPRKGGFEPAVWATSDPNLAMRYAKDSVAINGGRPIVMEVKIHPSASVKYAPIDEKLPSGSDTTLTIERGKPVLAVQSRGIATVEDVSKWPSKVSEDLAQLNQEYSALLTFKTAAEKRAAEARMLPPVPPETRTGTAPIADMRQLASTTENPQTRQALTAGLHEQLPPEEAQRLADMDRQQDLMSRLQAPLEHKAAREASPPTTLRHHAGDILHGIQNQAATGGGMLGLGLAASGHHILGASAVLAGLSAQYGVAIGARAERALADMVTARRAGMSDGVLRALGTHAGLPAQVTHDLIGSMLPRLAASAVTDTDAGAQAR